MIIVKVEGGLGNQLFQYAIGRNLALKNKTELGLDLTYYKKSSFREYQLNHFNIQAKEVKSSYIKYIDWLNSKNLFKRKLYHIFFSQYSLAYYKEKHFGYDEEVLECLNNTYLEGFWQSEKYFKEIKNELAKILIFDDEFSLKFIEYINDIKKHESVAIHIRRGDYLTNKNHFILDLDYYKKAIIHFKNNLINPKFYIFSDDIEWCRLNLKIDFPNQFVFGNDSRRDLQLMSLCDHFIIANSTFSWWGAYLGKNESKKIICPSTWFPKSSNKQIEDLLMNDWIKI